MWVFGQSGFSCWRGRKDEEVDIVADVQGRFVPFEVKYSHQHTGAGDLKGRVAFCTGFHRSPDQHARARLVAA